MAERVGNPVPKEIRARLDRHEEPLVYELVTRPKDADDPADGTDAAALADAIDSGDQHELLLTVQRLAVVTTDRRTKDGELVLSIRRDRLVAVDAAPAGTERGRVRFEFRDGSVAHGVMGLLLPRPARRFLDAYATSSPEGRRRR